jgi:hypothetical protein
MALPQYAERHVARPPVAAAPPAAGPAWQAYQILHWGFTILPIIAGIDKFTHTLATWPQYLAPAVTDVTGISATRLMMGVGVVEILAGLLVAFKPTIGGWVVAVWLWGIIANLFVLQGYYDIALRDFGLSLGAIALARLAARFDRAAA